jgi:hypothetical protein
MGKWRASQHWALRAADSDREVVVDQLREHCAAGRISMDEFEARLEETYAARTYRELAWVTRELPRLERRARFAHLNLGRHLALNGTVGGVALVAADEIGLTVLAATTGISAAVLAVQHRIFLRRIRRSGGRRMAWQVVAADRWRQGVTPPTGIRTQIAGGNVPWDWRQQQPCPPGRGGWPGHQSSRPTGTGGYWAG